MSDSYPDVHARNEQVLQRLVLSIGRELFADAAEEKLDGYVYGPGSLNELFPEYLDAPKQLGTIDSDILSIFTLRAMTYAQHDTVPEGLKSRILELGASALWEAAFVQTQSTHNSIDTVDQRLEYIDGYDRLNKAAQNILDPESEIFHRLALRRVFTPVLQDIVCGNITSDTTEEVSAALAEQLAGVRAIESHRMTQGLVGEIKVLQYYWSKYNKVGDMVAVPSTVRGGDGAFRPEETHDIDLLKQRKDRSWVLAPFVEVKKREIQAEEFKRYVRSILAYVAPDGTVSFFSSHRKHDQSDTDIAS